MTVILTKIVSSNICWKVTQKVTTEVLSEMDYMKGVEWVEKNYIKPLGEPIK